MSEQTMRHQLNPTVVKGIACAGAGLFVLAVPEISMPLLRMVVAGTLLVFGASDLWGHRRTRDSAHGPVRAVLALAAGLGVLVDPLETVRAVELIVAAYLAVLGALALRRGLSQNARVVGPRIDIGRGAILLAIAVVIVALPGQMLSLAIANAALAAVLVGLVMMVGGLRLGANRPDVANRGLALEVLWHWLGDRDIGPERRESIADSLYFEGPTRWEKLASYVVMLVLSVAIASLAVLQDSTAVIIGAMLIAPLMTPIMGCAAGLVAGWRSRAVASLGVVMVSVAAAIGLAWVLAAWIPALVPLAANSQVLSRSSPTLVDMAIALVAGAAGAYATVDERVSQSLTGVAIAVALVPPLGVVGVTLEAGRLHEAAGAFLLFATNLVSIILASIIVFVLIGFSPVKKVIEDRKTIADLLYVVAVVAVLIMVPLGVTGKGVLQRSQRLGGAHREVTAWLGADSTVKVVSVSPRPGEVDVVLSGCGEVPRIADLEEALSRRLGTRIHVTVEHFPSAVITAADQDGASKAQADPRP